MASPRNPHCANCIGTLSFPIKSCVSLEFGIAYIWQF